MSTKKSLGQHWLFDKDALQAMCQAGNITEGDNVLEIGPGLGTLTHELLNCGALVTAVELDYDLAEELEDKFKGREFKLVRSDILKFNFNEMPNGYKIVANIPYYLTSHLLRLICELNNKPSRAVLLVQKEVAERVSAIPGEMSILAVSVQTNAMAELGRVVKAGLFTPPPKVDSRILILDFTKAPDLLDREAVIRLAKAGFSNPRKKLRSSLAAGLAISVEAAEKILLSADIDPGRRAETLSLDEWQKLANQK